MGLRETLSLKEILEAATPGPWSVENNVDVVSAADGIAEDDAWVLWDHVDDARGRADASLIALAPELAALVLDMGEALAEYDAQCECGTCQKNAVLLARLDSIGKEQT